MKKTLAICLALMGASVLALSAANHGAYHKKDMEMKADEHMEDMEMKAQHMKEEASMHHEDAMQKHKKRYNKKYPMKEHAKHHKEHAMEKGHSHGAQKLMIKYKVEGPSCPLCQRDFNDVLSKHPFVLEVKRHFGSETKTVKITFKDGIDKKLPQDPEERMEVLNGEIKATGFVFTKELMTQMVD